MAKGRGVKTQAAKARVVAVRLSAEDGAALAAAAKRAEMPAARLARVLVSYGLAKLQRGSVELERAIRGSRDAKAKRVVKTGRQARGSTS